MMKMRKPAAAVVGAMFAAAAVSACGGGKSSLAQDVSVDPAKVWSDYQRPAEYTGVVAEDVFITAADGTQLAARLTRPAGDDGEAVSEPLPVILTITGYNARLISTALSGNHFVERGYAHLYVDERGTGSSGGTWESFGEQAQADFLDVLNWIDEQPWSDGNVGTWGASYMGITQFFTAQHQHPSHKAMFAIVPMGDAYRDIVFSGGQVNAGFIPLWMGLVSGLGALPAASLQSNPADGVSVLLDHISGSLAQFAVPTIAESVLGAAQAYDSEFWRIRSPLEVADKVQVPTFLVGGLNDLFQRGTPMLYEAIKDQVEAKLLIGPWTHLGGSSGEGLPADGVPSLDAIALQWFDRYLKDMDSGAEQQPDVTQYVYGEERYVVEPDWPHPQAQAVRLSLRGDRSLSGEPAGPDEASNMILQQPVNGVCSTSASQWTAGIIGFLPVCGDDNRLTEVLEITYTTPVMDEPLYVNGPIQANIWMSTTALDAGLVVRLTDVAPNGVSRELTNGIQTASMRALDPLRSRYLDGEMIQPWHTFVEADKQAPGMGNIVEVNVEIFPSSFVIQPGHALRVSVGASDLPHGLPPLPDLLSGLTGLLTIYSDAEHPSNVVLPVVERVLSAEVAAP